MAKSVRHGVRSFFWRDSGAAVLGILFFALTVGIEKVDPRNVRWLSFKDQKAHWMGWLFFADDQWRWPLGAIPRYGWGGFNSIVFTDSWPVFAVFFKLLNVEAIDEGQYFGIALLLCAISLFIFSSRLLQLLGLSRQLALLGSVIIGTTPMFWWMQRWYPAISGGLCLLVGAIYLYFRSSNQDEYRFGWWLLVVVLAVGTNIYLAGIIVPIFMAALLQRYARSRSTVTQIFRDCICMGVISVFTMYVLGYFTMPVGGATTNRYGVYTANLLGLIDTNNSSSIVPDIPSPYLQYEPTSVGIATLLLIAVLVFRSRYRRILESGLTSFRRHWLLVIAVLLMAAFAVSNSVTIGLYYWGFRIPARIEKLFSIFQSSVRFYWPLVLLVVVGCLVWVSRNIRRATFVFFFVVAVQIVDIRNLARELQHRPNGQTSVVVFDEMFWRGVPPRYTTFAFHYAENIRTGWDECALAAVRTKRVANCAYLSRSIGLEYVNARQEQELLSGELRDGVVYWITWAQLARFPEMYRFRYGGAIHGFALLHPESVSSKEFVLLFPYCMNQEQCSFLGDRRVTINEALLSINE